MKPPFPCPCCGYLVFDEPPGSYDICPICFWEDESIRLFLPLSEGGPNRTSLYKAQQSFAACGACDEQMVRHVRSPNALDQRDPAWRPFAPATDLYLDRDSEADLELWRNMPPEADPYYWSRDYWLRSVQR